MADIYKSKYTGEQIEEMLENASRVAKVEANPTGDATEELTKITIGDTTYSIPEGTEGTVVEGNPSGDATVELTKLKIGDTIYSIPQQSGGGGVYLVGSHSNGFIGGLTIYLADGTVSDRTNLGASGTSTEGVDNVRALKFTSNGYYEGVSMPDGILIKSNGTIYKIGVISSLTPPADTYYYIPFKSGTCYSYYS